MRPGRSQDFSLGGVGGRLGVESPAAGRKGVWELSPQRWAIFAAFQ